MYMREDIKDEYKFRNNIKLIRRGFKMRLIIDDLIKESGLKHEYIAKKLNINPRTLYKRRDLEYKNKLKLFLIIFERMAVTVGVYGFVVFKLICVKA